MGDFIKISKEEIERAFAGERRQYFVGDLKMPQNMTFLPSSEVEIALTAYDEYATEDAHVHSVAKEYQYVISGKTKYMNTDTKKIHEFKEGDFYAVYAGTPYAQKAVAGTKIIVVKEPSINDKQMVEMDEETKAWLKTPYDSEDID